MIISFSPVRSDEVLEVIKNGEALVLNGIEFDFSNLTEGATLPVGSVESQWISGDVHMEASQLTVTLILPHSAAAGETSRFPSPIINPPDGRITLPTDLDMKEHV